MKSDSLWLMHDSRPMNRIATGYGYHLDTPWNPDLVLDQPYKLVLQVLYRKPHSIQTSIEGLKRSYARL